MMLILRRGMFLAGCGIVAGTIVTLLLARFASTLLYGIKPTDPLTYAAVISSLVGVATLASLVPARRAASVDPLVAMQAE